MKFTVEFSVKMISTVHGARERGGVGSSTRGEGLGQGLGRRGDWGELVLKVREGEWGQGSEECLGRGGMSQGGGRAECRSAKCGRINVMSLMF